MLASLFTRRGLLSAILATTCLSYASLTADEPAIKPLRVLLVLGGCCHDYMTQKDLLAEGITKRAHVEVVIAYDPDKTTKHLNPVYENPDWAKGFDVIIHDECSANVDDLAVIDRILEPHRQGLPAVLLHCGMHSFRSQGFPKEVTPWFEFTGLQTTAGQAPLAIVGAPRQQDLCAGGIKDQRGTAHANLRALANALAVLEFGHLYPSLRWRGCGRRSATAIACWGWAIGAIVAPMDKINDCV